MFRRIRLRGLFRPALPVLLALSAWGAPVQAYAEDLHELLQEAAEHDAKYLTALHTSLAAAQNPAIAWADYLPRVSIQADGSQTNQDIKRVNNPLYAGGRTSYDTENYNFVIQQPVFNWETIERIGQADAQSAKALSDLEEARQDLILRVSEAYFNLLAAKNGLNQILVEKKLVAKHLEQATEQRRRGFAGRPDVADAQARLSLIEAKEIEARSQIQDGVQALAELTGKRPTTIMGVDREAPLMFVDPIELDYWIKASLDNSPSIRSKQQAVEVARKEMNARAAGHYPTLNLTAKYGRQDTGGGSYGGGGALVDTGQVMLSLNVPIYQGGKVSALEKQAEEQLNATMADEEQEKRTVERKTRAAYFNIKNSIKRADALKESVLAQEIALTAKRKGYQKGIFSIVDVLGAEKTLTEAQTEYEKARCEFFLNRLRLYQAVGEIKENDLIGINSWLKESTSLLD